MSHDERLAQLIETLTLDHRAGRPAAIERFARDEPELAEELRSLWAAALIAEELARDDGETDRAIVSEPNRPDGEIVGDCVILEELGREEWELCTAPGKSGSIDWSR